MRGLASVTQKNMKLEMITRENVTKHECCICHKKIKRASEAVLETERGSSDTTIYCVKCYFKPEKKAK